MIKAIKLGLRISDNKEQFIEDGNALLEKVWACFAGADSEMTAANGDARLGNGKHYVLSTCVEEDRWKSIPSVERTWFKEQLAGASKGDIHRDAHKYQLLWVFGSAILTLEKHTTWDTVDAKLEALLEECYEAKHQIEQD